MHQNLIHFDIRPTQNVVVMNNKKDGQWQSEIRDSRVVRKFERGDYDENFHLVVKYEEDKLVFFINGDKLKKTFPIRVPMREGRNVVLRDQEDLGRWKKLKIPEPRVTQESKGTSNVKLGEEMILEQALTVGDSIEVWGKYQDGDKYSFNIMRGKGDYLLHFDIRPGSGTICLDSTINTEWPGSLNLHLEEVFEQLARAHPNGDFHIKIEFAEDKINLIVNEMEVAEHIPYVFDLGAATHVLCFVPPGCSQNPWKKISLPKPRGILQTFGTYEFESLSIGDVINFSGRYRKEVDAFALNIMENMTNIQLHISIRPVAEAAPVVVLNTMGNGQWGQEMRAPIPDSLAACQVFDIFVLVEEKSFRIEFSKDEENENVLLEMKMPHREDFSKAKLICFADQKDNVWTELNMPDGTSYYREIC